MARQKTSGTSRSKRLLRGLLSIALPIQETKWYLRASQHITARNIARMNKALSGLTPADEPMQEDSPETSWEYAVAASGRTPAQLEAGYLAQRRNWRIIFWLLAIQVPLFMLTPFYSAAFFTFHEISTCLVLFSGAAIAWFRALVMTFRLWQLRTRRVSLSERGTFRHFMAENDALRDAITGR